MYLEYWGLKQFPFENVPDPQFMYYSHEHVEALARLVYAVKRRKGAALLTGDVGSGKTLLSRVFIQQLPEKDFEIGLITNPSLEPLDFLKEVLYQIGLNVRTNSKTELLAVLNTRLLENIKKNRSTLLIIDEAQLIRNETFEEIRLLLNFQLNDKFLMTFVLIGQPELKDLIRQFKQLDQRIAIRFHLNPLNADETAKYISYRLEKAGRNDGIFPSDSVEEIFVYSEGVPRKINNVCDLSLLIGMSAKQKTIGPDLIKKVIKDSL
ncbi:MAG TPA: AAA family ATPase [Syntrophales bacterium]|nr:AAA family ATPase [Syntrophales bacterium]